PWLWTGLVLVAAALLVAWLASRRSRAAPARRPGQGFAGANTRPAAPSTATPAGAADAAAGRGEPAAAPTVASAPAPASQAGGWNVPPVVATGASPTWHAAGGARVEAGQGAEVAPLNPAPAGQERIELARAYLD